MNLDDDEYKDKVEVTRQKTHQTLPKRGGRENLLTPGKTKKVIK